MTNRGNTADKPRRNSGNQFSLATTETWKIIAERLRKKETEGVVRGGDSSYQPRLACKPELTKLIVLGGRKSLGTMRHLNWLNADKLQRYTQPPVTLSLYFPSPCLRFLFSPVLVTTIGRNHSDLRLSGGLNERMESSGRFFRGNFYPPSPSWSFPRVFFRENDLLSRVQTPPLAHSSIYLSRGCIPFFWSLQFFLGEKEECF